MREGKNNRGAPPKLRQSSFRAYHFNGAAPTFHDQVSSSTITTEFGAVGVENGSVGKSIVFNNDVLLDSGVSVDQYFKNSFSFSTRLMVTSLPSASNKGTIISCCGDIDSVLAAENEIFTMQVNDNGNIEVENVAGGASFTNFKLVVNKTYNVTLTALRDALTYTYKLYINGVKVDEGVGAQPTDGGSAKIRIGGQNASGAIANQLSFKMSYAFLYSDVLSESQVQNDSRRTHLLDMNHCVVHKVEIENGLGAMINMSDLSGIDWVKKVTIEDSTDDPVRKATIEIIREAGGLSLATLNVDSKLNLTDALDPSSYSPMLYLNRDVKCYAARMPMFVTPEVEDYINIFNGFIQGLSMSSNPIKVNCLDNGKRLIDTYIEVEKDIAVGATATLEDTVAKIVNDNDSTQVANSYPPMTVFSPVPSQFILNTALPDGRQLKQRREPVMSAIRSKTGAIGWDVKYKYDNTSDSWKMTIYEPERVRSDVDIVLGVHDVSSVSALDLSLDNIRTTVRITYPTTEDALPVMPTLPAGLTSGGVEWMGIDNESGFGLASIVVRNVDSEQKYGRRFFEMSESSQSLIRDIATATRLASAVAQDLSQPDASYTAETVNMFELESGDKISMLRNKTLHSGEQKLASNSLTHTFGENSSTSISLTGKPGLGSKRWLPLGTRPGQARPPVVDPVNYDIDFTSGQRLFIPKVIAAGAYATDVVAPVIRNHSFSRISGGTERAPDSWTESATWGTHIEYNKGGATTGSQSVKFLSSSTGTPNYITSARIPISSDRPITLKWDEFVTFTGVNTNESRIWVAPIFYNSAGVEIGTPTYNTFSNVNSVSDEMQYRRVDGIAVPSNAKYVAVRSGADVTLFYDSSKKVSLDKVVLEQANDYVKLFKPSQSAISMTNGVYAQASYSSEEDIFDLATSTTVTIKRGGRYRIKSSIKTQYEIPKSSAYDYLQFTNLKINKNGAELAISTAPAYGIVETASNSVWGCTTSIDNIFTLLEGDEITVFFAMTWSDTNPSATYFGGDETYLILEKVD